MANVEEFAGKVLGVKLNEYKTSYDPSLLVPVPRYINREQYKIDCNNLPFDGWDIWHAYEVSFLTEKGLPVLGVGKLMYPANSPLFVESKSLKLYFYSFNMMKYGKDTKAGCEIVESMVKKDLSSVLGIAPDNVRFKIHLSVHDESKDCFKKHSEARKIVDIEDIEFKYFNEFPQVLSYLRKDYEEEVCVKIPFLRSNCRVTHQPDYGTLFVTIIGKNVLDISSLVQYIVSFRNENHFHEEVVEMVYKRLWDKLTPSGLFVGALYTRRGGIDICPMRYTDINLVPAEFLDESILTPKTLNQ